MRKTILIIAVLLLFSRCNLFKVTNPSNTTTDYLTDGQHKYWDQDFEGAVIEFEKAIAADPDNGEAYWWHAKAKIRTTGFTPIALINVITEMDSSGAILPFTEWRPDSASVIYEVLFDINDDLERLFYNTVEVGELDRRNVVFDYALSLVLQAVLMMRDTNIDDVIDTTDINLGSYFQDGEFNIPPEQWEQLQQVHRAALLDRVIYILERFSDVSSYIGEDFAGINMSRLRYTVDQILTVLYLLRMVP